MYLLAFSMILLYSIQAICLPNRLFVNLLWIFLWNQDPWFWRFMWSDIGIYRIARISLISEFIRLFSLGHLAYPAGCCLHRLQNPIIYIPGCASFSFLTYRSQVCSYRCCSRFYFLCLPFDFILLGRYLYLLCWNRLYTAFPVAHLFTSIPVPGGLSMDYYSFPIRLFRFFYYGIGSALFLR